MPKFLNIAKSLSTQPGYTIMRGLARFPSVRKMVSRGRETLLRRETLDLQTRLTARVDQSIFGDLDRTTFTSQLRNDGVAFGLKLPMSWVNEIRNWAESVACYADRNPSHGFQLQDRSRAESHLRKPILLAQYFNTSTECLAVAKLIDDPKLWLIASEYLGSCPTFVGANLWWNFPVDALAADRDMHAHVFHRDVDDFRFFKFFFYLTDVTEGDGAHVCVRGSQARPPEIRRGDRWNIRRYTDDEIARTYDPGDVLTISGTAGTGFAENTLCIHKASTPVYRPRLLLQLQFALFDYDAMHDRRPASMLKILA